MKKYKHESKTFSIDVKEVTSKIDIVNLISENVQLKKSGQNYMGLCPFHQEKTPSFSVNEQKQFFKCFGCGASGDAISYYKQFHKTDFKTALAELARRAGVTENLSNIKKDPKLKDQFLRLTKQRTSNIKEDMIYAEQGILYFMIKRPQDIEYIKAEIENTPFLDKANNYIKTKLLDFIPSNKSFDLGDILMIFDNADIQAKLCEITTDFEDVDTSTTELLQDYLEVIKN
jgi:DNA primase